jgi:putative transposase
MNKKNQKMEPLTSKFTNENRVNLEWLLEQPLDVKMEVMKSHLSICQIIANQVTNEELINLAGARYSRDKPLEGRYSRWGSNPGSIRIGDHQVRVEVPRVRDMDNERCQPLESYQGMRSVNKMSDQIVDGVIQGLSMRDYEGVIDHMSEGFGLSKSAVSRRFVEDTRDELQAFMDRDLSGHHFIAIFIDGKSFGGEQIIIALGVTEQGKKMPLEFVQAHSEKAEPVAEMLRRIKGRGVQVEDVLYILDGSKGFRKAVKQVCGEHTLIQRCTWHKFENIKSYLAQSEHDQAKADYYEALGQESYEAAKTQLLELESRMRSVNVAAANSILEALEEILTLHKIGINQKLWPSFRSTNCIESLNSQIGKYIRKVTNWQSSDQRYRWTASALLESEKKMHRIRNYRLIPLMKKAILLHYNKHRAAS